MNPSDLDAIRERYANGFGDIEQAAEDVQTLLAYIDETAEQIHAISERVAATLDTARVLLAMRLVQDGHAATMGEAFELAADTAKVADLYPVPA